MWRAREVIRSGESRFGASGGAVEYDQLLSLRDWFAEPVRSAANHRHLTLNPHLPKSLFQQSCIRYLHCLEFSTMFINKIRCLETMAEIRSFSINYHGDFLENKFDIKLTKVFEPQLDLWTFLMFDSFCCIFRYIFITLLWSFKPFL